MSSKDLVSTYKKHGFFDNRRKSLLNDFKKSQTHANLMLKLQMLVESKVKADPSLLLQNRGRSAALVQGSIIQHQSPDGIVGIVDQDIQEKIIDSPEFKEVLMEELGDIHRKNLGISDEEWAQQKLQRLEKKRAQQEREEKLRQEEKREKQQEMLGERGYNPYRVKKITKAPSINLLKY